MIVSQPAIKKVKACTSPPNSGAHNGQDHKMGEIINLGLLSLLRFAYLHICYMGRNEIVNFTGPGGSTLGETIVNE